MSNLFSQLLKYPKYAVLWLLAGLLWLLCRLPFKVQLIMGKFFGRSLGRVKKVRHCTEKNIAYCYPDLSQQQQKNMAQKSCVELGISLIETFKIWFDSVDNLCASKATTIGEEHLRDALAQDKGIILLTCHFGSMDVNAALLSKMDFQGRSFNITYRKPANTLVDKFLRSARSKICDNVLPIQNLRGIVQELKNNNIIWIAPDIEVKNKTAVFVTFQGVNASTTTIISRLSRITGALVVPVSHSRTCNAPSYQLEIHPALSNFPSKDVVADTQKINHCIEKLFAQHPERYWWCIKRFKKRPKGEARIY